MKSRDSVYVEAVSGSPGDPGRSPRRELRRDRALAGPEARGRSRQLLRGAQMGRRPAALSDHHSRLARDHARSPHQPRLSAGIGRPAGRCDEEARRGGGLHDGPAARRLAGSRIAGSERRRLDRRQHGRAAARRVGQGARGAAAGALVQQRPLRGQRVRGHGAQRQRAAARARPHRRHPHQPPHLAGTRGRVEHRRRAAAGGQRARREAAADRHAHGPADRRGAGAPHRAPAQRAP